MLRRPDLRVTLPHAPRRPVTINMGMVMPAWYDIRTMERVPNRESEEDIETSAGQIEAALNHELERGVPPDRLVLAGFSQGAAMALHVGLRFPQQLAGIISLSGYVVLEEQAATGSSEANRSTPIFMGHGTQDPVVPLDAGHAARDLFTPGRDLTWGDYPMEHAVCPEEIEAVAAWLGKVLPT
jgi:phospholipase/carboxylesterase